MKYKATIEIKECPVCNQDKPHHAKGLCNACYHRLARKTKPVDKVGLTVVPDSGTL